MVHTKQEGNTLYHQGCPCLFYSVRLPYLVDNTKMSSRFPQFYQNLGQLWKTRWTEDLYPQIPQYWDKVTPWTGLLDYTVHLDTKDYLSLTFTATERWNQQEHSLRISDTWDKHTGYPLRLSQLYPTGMGGKSKLLQQIRQQADRYVASGESLFYGDYTQRLTRFFDPQAFYLTEEGLHFYYPLGGIGSKGEGFPDFLISKENLSLKCSV